jgi:hypothetical protein
MIYIFQVPCDIISGICSGTCQCTAALCNQCPEATRSVSGCLASSCKEIASFIGSLNCFKDQLGGFLLMSCVVNGIVIWNALRALSTTLVTDCSDSVSSVGSMGTLMQTDLVFAIAHVVFVLYLKCRVNQEMERVTAEEPQLTGKTSVVLRKSVVELMKRDFGVCFYVFFWVYVFYHNCVGLSLVAKCESDIKVHNEHLAKNVVGWLMAYAPLTLFYGCYLNTKMCCMAAGDRVGFQSARAHAREGTVPYLPLAAEEPPQCVAVPQV